MTPAGEGIVRSEDRIYFVHGVLPGEKIRFAPRKKRKGKLGGQLQEILKNSPDRVDPICHYFGACGGCTLQHLKVESQRQTKQKILLDQLNRVGKVVPRQLLPLLAGDAWNYRRKARPGCKFVLAKGGILVGFREPGHSYLTSLRHCHTMDERLSKLLDPFHDLIASLDCVRQVPQLEFAAGDTIVAVVLRHLVPLSDRDVTKMIRFAKQQSIQLYVQPAGISSIRPLWPTHPEPLRYTLEEYDITLQFAPTDFIQVNGRVNADLVHMAINLLALEPDDHILDLFCGMGNFTLPMARVAARIIGVEGESALVEAGSANARLNGLENVEFLKLDLFASDFQHLGAFGCNKILLDPPRSGALKVVEHLVQQTLPGRIVYVSCNPATLARDAEILVHQHGYDLSHVGVVDMFPHTAHIESIAVFQRALI